MNSIVEVSHLSKKYRKGERIPYYSLRDSIAGAIRSLGRRNLQLQKDEFWALKNVSFTVREGEVIGIIGRNGAGKSTLLKILGRITPPTEGCITLRGRVANLLEVGTGFHPELTGRENIYLNGAILGMRRNEVKRKFDEIVAFSEVSKFLDMPVKHYSSGMYMRLAFAVAAHLESEILLVDEVLAVGDAQFQKKCLSKMSEVSRAGRTVFFVSHNLAALQSLCTQGLFLSKGQVISQGKISSVIKKYYQSFSTSKSDTQTQLHKFDRAGSGNMRFQSITFVDNNGKDKSSIKSGEPLTIKLRYTTKRNVELKNVNISVALNNIFGQRVTIFNNKLKDGIFSTIPNKGLIIVSIDSFPLTPGRYDLNVFAEINGEIADWLQEAAFISVDSNAIYRTESLPIDAQGSVYLPYTMRCDASI